MIPMTKTHDSLAPAALREVWEWKDCIYQEVAHLPLEEALRVISEKARVAGEEFDRSQASRHHQ